MTVPPPISPPENFPVSARRNLRYFMPMNSPRSRAFTLVELLTVMAIIAILAGLTLQTVGYVQKKAARSRAEAEMRAMEAAMESYKADNGIYPRDTATDSLDARTSFSPTAYATASRYLYRQLSGDLDGDATRAKDADVTQYFGFKPNMLNPTGGTGAVTSILDPFGFNYGYSTAYAKALEDNPAVTPEKGYNPTFDLWSTSGKSGSTDADKANWITNW